MFQFEVPLCFFFPLGDYSGRCIISWDPGTEAQMDYLQMYRRDCYNRRDIWKMDLVEVPCLTLHGSTTWGVFRRSHINSVTVL